MNPTKYQKRTNCRHSRLLTAAALLTLAQAAFANSLLVEDVTVVSAHLDQPAANRYVLIRDGRVAEISTEPTAAGEDTMRIDGRSLFLTPGLTDAHHHVSYAPGLGPLSFGVATEFPELADAYVAQQPRSLLYHGVTQILDPSPLDAWQRFEAEPLHPDLFRCGEIPNPGGYPENQMQWEGAPDAFRYRLTESPASVVKRIADDGAICVKIYIEDGFGDSRSWPILDDETIGQLRAAAHERGLLIYAHANAIDMHQIALRNEVDVLGHGLWNWQWADDPDNPPVQETLDNVIAAGVGFIPTHRVMAGIAGHLRPETLDDPEFLDVVPQALLDWYTTDDAQWFTEELTADFPPDMSRARMADILGSGHVRAQRATRYLSDADYPLLLGSDCPGSPTIANQPGLCTLQEMRSMAEAGVPLSSILEAGTLNNSKRFGLGDDYGTIEVGKIANLLLLGASPLEDIEAWNDIRTVILHGEAIERASLSAR